MAAQAEIAQGVIRGAAIAENTGAILTGKTDGLLPLNGIDMLWFHL